MNFSPFLPGSAATPEGGWNTKASGFICCTRTTRALSETQAATGAGPYGLRWIIPGRLIRDGRIDYRKAGGVYQYALKPFDHRTIQTTICLEDHTSLRVWTAAGDNGMGSAKAGNPCGFWIPPALTEEERRELALKYPNDIERFWAEQDLREQKAREEEAKWAY